jgi:hypothetical protein
MAIFQKDWRTLMVNDVSPAIDRELGGEPFRIIPATKRGNVNAQAVPDVSRAITVIGIFGYRFKAVPLGIAVVASRDPIVRFGYYALNGFSILHYYVVERGDGTRFEVTATKPDGVSSVTCDLVQLGRASPW